MARPGRGSCCCRSLLFGLLLIAPGLVTASLPHNSYLHLVNRHRRLQAAASTTGACGGRKAGEPIEGRYIVVFDSTKVATVSEGVAAVRQKLQQQAVQPQSAFPGASSQASSPADPFAVVTALTTVPEPSSSAQGRRLLGRRMQRSRYLGAVVRVPPGAAGDALIKSINSTDAVKTAVADLCVKALDSQERFTCLPATMLASSIHTPIAAAAWDGCLTSNTYLAWYGERCGSAFNQVLWTGVFAFDKTTGARLSGCVKQRPPSGASTADISYWLGTCGENPAVLPSLPNRVCQDAFVADTIVPADQQGCVVNNFTDATQTADIFHPLPGCGSGQPVSMTYRGQRCTGNNGGSSSTAATAGILWQTAEPAAGSGLDPTKCSLARRVGTAADDLIFDMEWFGSCGVPPSRVQYIPRSECPAAPPPPPPSPSPRPEDQKALDREPLLQNEVIPTGILRIQAVTPNANSSSGYDTVKLMRPVTVAVMDSGVDCFHRDLNVVFNTSFADASQPNDVTGDRKGCWDVFDHGTNVAGIIGAKNNGFGVVGVMPNAAIASLKILDASGAGPTSAILNACLWLMQRSLDSVNTNDGNVTNAEALGVDVINMSFGYPGTPYTAVGTQVCEVMRQLREELGIVAVAAAGNEGQPLNNMMPAACAGVIAVTAIDQRNGSVDVTQTAPSWSNFLNLATGSGEPATAFKNNLTIAAPGMDIYSSCYQQNQAYCFRSGTSQATPHVTGMIARCFSGGRCQSRGNGTQSVWYTVNKWQGYNDEYTEYGFAKDPIHWAKSVFYYGYLSCADVW